MGIDCFLDNNIICEIYVVDLSDFMKWRTVRDSNPRYPYEYASLAGMWFQPTHPTVLKSG